MNTAIMKMIIIPITALIFSFNGFAGNPKEHPEKYCAKMKDGKKVVMHQGSAITSEVTLKNGTKIMPDGTVIKPDGDRVELRDDECISTDGTIAMEKKKR